MRVRVSALSPRSSGPRAGARSGAQVTLRYSIIPPSARAVDLGVALYDDCGEDMSTGVGDLDNQRLAVEKQSVERPVVIPAGLVQGRYEVVACRGAA
jgi:hypothetical protein